MSENNVRSLAVIACEIRQTWVKINKNTGIKTQNVWFGAKPYLDAMSCLDDISDNYGMDSGVSIVNYFLCNASQFKGEDAKRIKAELKEMVKSAK